MPSGCISLLYFPSRDKGVFGVLLWAVRILLRRRSSTISSSVISLVVEFYQDISVNIIKMLCSSSDHYLLLGTKLVWNSVRSKLRVPLNLREAVMEDTT